MNTQSQSNVLLETNIHLEPQLLKLGIVKVHEGKVRDSYISETGDRIVITTDRVSAFDRVMPFGVPQKGAVLNMLSEDFMRNAETIVPSWLHENGTPHPQVAIGKNCEPIKVEMIVRGYLCGTAWRAYKKGVRNICGVDLPDGLVENQKLPHPIITPTTKADIGKHDENITPEAIVESGLCSQTQYEEMADISLKLFEMGSLEAEKAALILVDTKFEFGTFEGRLHLIDELLTPDSSRYFDLYYYTGRQAKGEKQEDLSKEYLRKLLMSRGFAGEEGQEVPHITQEEIEEISLRYRSVYERLVGAPVFEMDDSEPRIASNSPKEEEVRSRVYFWFVKNRKG